MRGRFGRAIAGALGGTALTVAIGLAPAHAPRSAIAAPPAKRTDGGKANGENAIAQSEARSGASMPLLTHDVPPTARRCLACHIGDDGALDLVGLEALEALPPEWALLSEDAFDLDGDGIGGRLRYVSGEDGPIVGVYGRKLAAGRLGDFARIAGAAHGIDVSDPAVLDETVAALLALSPDPAPIEPGLLAGFETRGCATCHVTRGFEHDGRTYRPLSDFLLHDLGDGPVRTAPLWGCPECLRSEGHPGSESRTDR